MKRNRPPAADWQAARVSRASKRTFNLPRDASPDNSPPIEVHDPLADDKRVLFHVVTPRMLARLAEHFRRCPVRRMA
jgi:hypothetical protein